MKIWEVQILGNYRNEVNYQITYTILMANINFRILRIPVSCQSDIEIFRTVISRDDLYGCKMGHPSFMEEHRLGVFENGAVHGMCVD